MKILPPLSLPAAPVSRPARGPAGSALSPTGTAGTAPRDTVEETSGLFDPWFERWAARAEARWVREPMHPLPPRRYY